MRCVDRLSSYTSSADPGIQFIGGGPTTGDIGTTGIIIPADPTVNNRNRYLIRLAGITIPPDFTAIVRSIRQYVTIGTEELLGQEGGQLYVFEKEIVFPTWRFNDGNIAWGLTIVPPTTVSTIAANLPISSVGHPSPYIEDSYGITPGILYRNLPTSVDPVSAGYVPPFNGSFPGTPISNLGIWRDLRYTWYNYNDLDSNGYAVNGPGNLCLWASVYQTNPSRRSLPPLQENVLPSWLSAEDQFVYAYQTSARYWRIAGELIVDLIPKVNNPI